MQQFLLQIQSPSCSICWLRENSKLRITVVVDVHLVAKRKTTKKGYGFLAFPERLQKKINFPAFPAIVATLWNLLKTSCRVFPEAVKGNSREHHKIVLIYFQVEDQLLFSYFKKSCKNKFTYITLPLARETAWNCPQY